MDADDLVTFRELEHLKYRYLRCLDTKDWDGFEDCFVPEATAAYGAQLHFEDRDAIVAFMRESIVDTMVTVHQVHHPELEVDGDLATGTWMLMDRVIVPEFRIVLDGASVYRDRYLRVDDRWRIAHTGYERLYEAVQSLDDTPSWQLNLGPWTKPVSD